MIRKSTSERAARERAAIERELAALGIDPAQCEWTTWGAARSRSPIGWMYPPPLHVQPGVIDDDTIVAVLPGWSVQVGTISETREHYREAEGPGDAIDRYIADHDPDPEDDFVIYRDALYCGVGVRVMALDVDTAPVADYL